MIVFKSQLFLVFFIIFISSLDAALTVFPVKVGETLVLDVGREVHEWKRVRNGVEETIKPCKKGEKEEKGLCDVWTTSNSKKSGDGREHMNINGTLVIKNFQFEDSGDYYSNDELERVHYTADGQIWKLARTRIAVLPID